LQQEKEALDDLAMELELADEDQPVLYVGHTYQTTSSELFFKKATRLARPSFTFHIIEP
jgi:prefoldin subunit 4